MKPSALLVALAAVLAACNNNSGGGGGGSLPATVTYTQDKTVAIPGVPPATGTFSFDIGFFDATARRYYLADRTTKGVDVIDGDAVAYLRTAGAGSFTGASIGGASNTGGPNGVVPVGNNLVFAGDGDSSMKVVNAATGALVATTPVVTNPYTGASPVSFCGAVSSGTANLRMDEMAYDPADGIVLGINDAACPPFGTFFSADASAKILGQVSFPTANGGAEQPTWDPAQGRFLLSIPSTTANAGGEIDVIDPKAMKITSVYPLNNCNPTGNALGKNETLFIGCATQQLLAINATNGTLRWGVPNVGGADETWYNPTTDRFYCGCSNNLSSGGGPMLVIVTSSGVPYQFVGTSAGAHSVAVDPQTDRVYVPQRASGLTTFLPH